MATLNQDTNTKSSFSISLSILLDKIIFICLVALIPLTAIPYGSIDPLPEAISTSIVFILAALWFLQGALSGKLFVKQHAVVLPCLALIIYAALQAIPFGQVETADASIKTARSISLDPYETWHVILRFAAYTLYGAMLLRFISNGKRLQWLIFTIILTATASALFGFYLKTTARNKPDSLLPRIFTTRGFAQFINKNNFAYLMEMSAGLAAGFLVSRGINKRALVFCLAALPVIIAGLVLSMSRGGVISLIVQSLFAGLIVALTRFQKHDEEENEDDKPIKSVRSITTRVPIAFALVLAITIGVFWFGGDDLISKFEATPTNFSVGALEQNVSRKQIWQATWSLFKDNPIAGVGFGAYWVGVTNYDDTTGNMALHQAHNDYLEFLASGGIISLALVVWLICLIAKRARANLFSIDSLTHAACVGALIGCIGIAVHSVFDFGLHTPVIAFVFAALIAIALYVENGDNRFYRLSKPLQISLAVIGIFVFLFFSWITIKRGSGRVLSESASTFQKARNDDANLYLSLAQRAIEVAPNDPEAYAAMALVYERNGDDAKAVTYYEKALSLRPSDYNLWMRLGRAREHVGEIDKAIIAFREALKLAKLYARPKWLLGNALLRAGQPDEALTLLRAATTRDTLLLKQVMPIAWFVLGQDVTSFLKYITPQSDDEKLAVGKFLIEKGKSKEGQELLFSAGEKGFEDRNKLVAELFKANRFREAFEIWSKGSVEKDRREIINGSFENDIKLNETMFGWQITQNADGANVALADNAAQDGQHSLFVTYSGSNEVALIPVKQLVVVKPNTKFHLTFAIKTQELISGGLPVIKIIDVINNKEIASSKPFPVTTSSWELFEFEFTADSNTEAIFVALGRQPCSSNPCPIFGKVWLDNFSLKP